MKRNTRNAALALVGLAALAVYILACTSFSPDDKQVLYPAFDESGTVGLANYDRASGRSEVVFVPASYEGTNARASLVRGQWLPDGRRILAFWADPDREEMLNLGVLPVGARGTVKFFTLHGMEEPGWIFTRGLALSGDEVFVATGKKGVARLNLKTGELSGHEYPDMQGEITLYPRPNGDGVFYLHDPKDGESKYVFGRMDPRTFGLTPLTTITNDMLDGSFFAYDPQGTRIAIVEKTSDNQLEMVVLKDGKTELRKGIGRAEPKVTFGSAVMLPGSVVASYQRLAAGEGGSADFGIMEIPFGKDGAVRETRLLHGPGGDTEEAMYFQVGVSHDGKTAAVASTYLNLDRTEEELKQAKCALFLVDLSDPQRKVTTVPIHPPRAKDKSGG